MKNKTLAGLRDASHKEKATRKAFQDAIAEENRKIEELKSQYESMRTSAEPDAMVSLQLEIGNAENRITRLEKSLEDIKPIYSNDDVSKAAIERCIAYKNDIHSAIKSYQKAREELAKTYVALVKKESELMNDLDEIKSYYDTSDFSGKAAFPIIELDYKKLRRAEQFDDVFKRYYKEGELREPLLYCNIHIGGGIQLSRD